MSDFEEYGRLRLVQHDKSREDGYLYKSESILPTRSCAEVLNDPTRNFDFNERELEGSNLYEFE